MKKRRYRERENGRTKSAKNPALWQLLKFMMARGKAKSVTIDICVFLATERQKRRFLW